MTYATPDAYTTARNAPTGSTIKCPGCGKSIVKTTYHKVFCSNQKTHRGRSSCKDRYWNTVNPRGEVGRQMVAARRDQSDWADAPGSEYRGDGWGEHIDQHPHDLDDGHYSGGG